MKKVTEIKPTVQPQAAQKKLRVAAYCRVSTGSEAQLDSLDTQREHYENYISARSDWENAGIFYDEGVTGTKKEKRPGLLALMEACENHQVDFIVTKSLSRFSRNTTDCLELVRRLLALNIPIFFERENLNTASMESELMLSVLSSMAEGESVSISDNSKWSVKKRFENGTFKIVYPPYGYDWVDGEMLVNEEQAAIVRQIFADYLSGMGTTKIAKKLNRQGLRGKKGSCWSDVTIAGMLTNETYTGDAIFQKTYTDQQFNRHHNTGILDRYFCPEHHPAIISHEDFDRVALLIRQRRREKGSEEGTAKNQNRYAFSGKLLCGACGDKFKRRIHTCQNRKYVAWCCNTHIQDVTSCSMLFVKNEDVECAFLTLLNKLIYSHKAVLAPLLEALKNNSTDDGLLQIKVLETELLQLAEQRQTLQRLMAAGYLDQIVFTRQKNELLTRTANVQREIELLQNTSGRSTEQLKELQHLLHFAEKAALKTTFDETLFTAFADHAIFLDRQTVEFHLKCGLILRERL